MNMKWTVKCSNLVGTPPNHESRKLQFRQPLLCILLYQKIKAVNKDYTWELLIIMKTSVKQAVTRSAFGTK